MSWVAVSTVAALALATSASVAGPPPGFYEAKALEPAASFVAGKPAHVYCASNHSIWWTFANGNGTPDAIALTRAGTDRSEFEPLMCSTLRAQLKRQPVTIYTLAASLRVLVHESIHERGVVTEGEAECSAMHEMPGVAVRFFGVTAGKQVRALMAQAWKSHRAGPLYFQTVC
ncbi:MAG: hypothetical protein ACXVRU_10850 [Gaiellaceae bacterium]